MLLPVFYVLHSSLPKFVFLVNQSLNGLEYCTISICCRILFFQDLYLTAFSSFILSCFNRCPKFNSNSVNFLFAEPFLTFVSTFYGQTGANDSQWNTAVSSQNVIKHECPKCGKTYKYNQNLKRHMKYECGKPPTLKCPHCDYITFYKYDLFNHAIRRHPNDYMKMRNDFVATKP